MKQEDQKILSQDFQFKRANNDSSAVELEKNILFNNSFKDFGAKNAVVAKVGAKKAGRQKMLFGSKKLRLVAADVVVEASEQAADAAPTAADVADADADT